MATKNIVPNADSEGGIGTSSKYWATGFIDAITTTGNLVIGGSIDLEGAIDVNGTTNLDIVDIDGAVNIGAEVTLAAANKIIFNDASQFIHASSNAILNLGATDEIDLTATAIDVNGTMDVSGAFTNGSTLVSTGKITADAGIDIDNINIDGTTISLSSGTLTLDAVGQVHLDSEDEGSVQFKTNGTSYGLISNTGNDFKIKSVINNGDIIFQGVNDTTGFTALTLDMSSAGAATFGGTINSYSIFSEGMIRVTQADIGSGETTGLQILRSGGAQIWNITSGISGSDNTTFNIRNSTSHTNVFSIDASSNNATIQTGNLVIGTAGKGIDFGTETPSGAGRDSNAGGDGNILDDYEEGSFTAAMTAQDAGTIAIKSSTHACTYTKIGRVINISGYFQVESISSSPAPSGRLKITGLPLTQVSDGVPIGVAYINGSNAFTGFGVMLGDQGTGVFIDRNSVNGATAATDMASAIKVDTEVYFNLTYTTNT
jgi:hypothetical protein